MTVTPRKMEKKAGRKMNINLPPKPILKEVNRRLASPSTNEPMAVLRVLPGVPALRITFRLVVFLIPCRICSESDSGSNAGGFNLRLYKSTSRNSSGGPKINANHGKRRPPNDAISATKKIRLAVIAKMMSAFFPIPLFTATGVFSATSMNAACTSCRVRVISAQTPIGSPSSDPGLGINCRTPAATANPYD